MKKILGMLAVLFLAVQIVILPAGVGFAADGDLYIVQPGDSLSGIAAKKLGSMNRWREILDLNPQVTDPALIYPGDSLALPSSGEETEGIAISTGEEVDMAAEPYQPLPVEPPAEETEAAAAAAEEPMVPVEEVKPVPVISGNIYRSAGYISTDLPEITILSSPETKVSLVEGDEIIISAPAEEGMRFTVVRADRRVHHPRSGDYLGRIIRILGWAEVTCSGENTATAILTGTTDVVNVGDYLVPFDPDDILEENMLRPKQSTFCLEKGDEGFIVAAESERKALGEGDIVFIDRGRSAGVEPGQQFVVYRQMTPEGIYVTGQLQVLRTGENTSTTLVTNSMEEIGVEDFIQAWEAPAAEDPSSGG